MNLFEKARELGELIILSEQNQKRENAKREFEQDEEAVSLMNEYSEYQNEVRIKMESGYFSKEEFTQATEDLKTMGASIKKHPVAGTYIATENEYNAMVNQVFEILNYAITGEEPNEYECGESCGCGCSDCGSDTFDCSINFDQDNISLEGHGCSCGCDHDQNHDHHHNH